MLIRAKDDEGSPNFNSHYEKQAYHEVDPSFPTNCGLQPTCIITGDGNEGPSTQPDNAAWGGTDKRDDPTD